MSPAWACRLANDGGSGSCPDRVRTPKSVPLSLAPVTLRPTVALELEAVTVDIHGRQRKSEQELLITQLKDIEMNPAPHQPLTYVNPSEPQPLHANRIPIEDCAAL